MQKNKSIHSTFDGSDFLTAIGCFVGMAICLVFFWQDLNMSLSRQNEQPVAIIYFKHNTAQRRLVDRNLWERLKQASPVYNGDRIRTAALSEAVAVFPDGVRLELQENTLIQLFKVKEQTAVDFVSGSMVASTSGTSSVPIPLRVTAAGKTMSFTAETSAVVAVPTQSLPLVESALMTPEVQSLVINVTKGDIQLRDSVPADIPVIMHRNATSVSTLLRDSVPSFVISPRDEPSQELVVADSKVIRAGDSIVISNSVTDSTQTIGEPESISVILPAGSTSIVRDVDQNPSIAFVWECPDSVATQLEFSYDADFSTIMKTCIFPAGQKAAFVPLAVDAVHDVLFWRAFSQQATTKDVSQGTVFIRSAPEKSINEMLSVVFTNIIPAVAEPVTEVVATQTEPVIEHSESTSEAAALPVISEPTVTAVEPVVASTEDVIASPVVAFSSLQPVLTLPKSKAIFDDVYFEKNENITFVWNEVPNATMYNFVLEFCQSDGTRNQLLTHQGKKNRYVLSGEKLASVIDSGNFVWTVSAQNKAQEVSGSAFSEFSVQLGSLGSVEVDTSGMINSR